MMFKEHKNRHDKDVWLSDDGTPLYKIHRFTDHFICDFDCSDDKLCSEYIYKNLENKTILKRHR